MQQSFERVKLQYLLQGINKCESAKNAYLKAIECLQDTNRTPAQEKQKKQYEIGLREAEELLRTKKAELHVVNEENVKYTPLGTSCEDIEANGLAVLTLKCKSIMLDIHS